jgi:hypothetical protein
MIKHRYGGLKKLLYKYSHIFSINSNHPHNPQFELKALPSIPRSWTRFLLCPLTASWLHDPIVASDGYTYSREALQKHIQEHGWISPTTGQVLEQRWVPNHRLQELVRDGLKDFRGSCPTAQLKPQQANKGTFDDPI